jgi:hypothetical protein
MSIKNDGFYYAHELTTEAIDFIIEAFHSYNSQIPDATYWKLDSRGNVEWLLSSPKSTVGRWVLYHFGEKVASFNPELLETLLRRFNTTKPVEEI